MWPAVVMALAIGAAVSLYVFRLRPLSRAPMRTSPLTSFPGQERYPSFSPDGNQIAFAWDGGNGDNQDIYIKVVGAGVPLRLTTHPAADQKPVWSSDGRHIAFVRSSEEGGGHLRDSRARWSRAQNRVVHPGARVGGGTELVSRRKNCWRFLKARRRPPSAFSWCPWRVWKSGSSRLRRWDLLVTVLPPSLPTVARWPSTGSAPRVVSSSSRLPAGSLRV